MSSRVFVRGAGVACLAAAVVGYSLATEDNGFLPRLPGDGDDADREAGRKPLLRSPLPQPSFGAAATRLPSATGTSTKLATRRKELLGSASRVPLAGLADLARPVGPAPILAVPLPEAAPAAQQPGIIAPEDQASGSASLAQTAPVRVPGFAETFRPLDRPDSAAATAPPPLAQSLASAPEPLPEAAPEPEVSPATLSAPFVSPAGPAGAPIAESGESITDPGAAEATVPPVQPVADPAPVAQDAPPFPPPRTATDAPAPAAEIAPPPAPENAAPVEAASPPLPPPPAKAIEAPAPAPLKSAPVPLAPPPAVAMSDDAEQGIAALPPAEETPPVAIAPVAQTPDVDGLQPEPEPGPPPPPPPLAPVAPQTAPAVPSPTTASPSPAGLAELLPMRRETTTLGLPGNASAQPAAALAAAPNGPFPATSGTPLLSYQDELILEVQVNNADETDTIIAYGTRGGVYLPLGAIARILDLAVTVTDEGRYAHGWVLSEDRTVTIDLRGDKIELPGRSIALQKTLAADLDGELYLRIDQFPILFPLEVKADLRTQQLRIKTLEPFPFEARLARERQRERMAAREAANGERANFERIDLPYRAVALPSADIELRAVSDRIYGPRAEGDILLAGDIGYLSGEAYLSGDTSNGLVASLLRVGRMDPDAQLLGPLKATSFSVGDVNSTSMALGLRSVSGRGLTLTNAPSQVTSVFDKVDLRGILPDGYEVELYRNEILVGSTRDAVNGQYEFLRIPVDFGLNVFRLVFFGPQGQRSETVQRISVGDGRVADGKLVYSMDLTQREENVLGVRTPGFVKTNEFGNWRASAQLAFGLTPGLTGMLGGAWLQTFDGDRWLANAGLRTSIAGLAVKADAGLANGGAAAFGVGVGGRFGRSAITVSHTEFAGQFPDETKIVGSRFLRRATEVDLNTSLAIAGDAFALPVSARFRNYVDVDGRNTLIGGLRASTRTKGLLVSNTLEYSRISASDLATTQQLYGNFDLATLSRGKTRGRLSLGYQLLPQTTLGNASLEIDHAIDEKTSIRGVAGYDFVSDKPRVGISGVRDFERFSLALDANYSFVDETYFVGLRLGFSLGRDPLRGRPFVSRPGLASSGGATLRAFQDMDGDGVFGDGDTVLPGVDLIAFNQTAKTDDNGIARLTGLGVGRPVSLQMDATSLPDIDMAPVAPGYEVVPRAGRIHAIDYAVVALSEVEGMARFVDVGAERGVSGVRLQLVNAKGEVVAYAKTELDGYYFFERVAPGTYRLQIEPEQMQRLQLCPVTSDAVFVGHISEVVSRDLAVRSCAGDIARSGE